MEQIRRGSVFSLENLFERYYAPLCNFSFLFIKDAGLSEELVSDVFIRIWKKHDELKRITNVKAYLYRSVKNAVISSLRKNRVKLEELVKGEDIAKLDITPETLLINSELKDSIRKMIDAMPRQAGLVFRMHRVDGLTYKEIAMALDLSVKTIESHMSKALRFVKDIHSKHPHYF